MKRIVILSLFTGLVFLSLASEAALLPRGKKFVGFPDDTKAVGVFLGEPLALRGYLFTSWKRAFAASLGYSFNKTVQGSVDYLFYGYSTRDKVVDRDFWNSLIFFAGPGVLAGVGLEGSANNNSFQVGARVVGGTEYIFTDSPWSFRLELAPQFYFKGNETFGVSVGVGATYYFADRRKPVSTRRLKKGAPSSSSSDISEEELEEFE